MRDKQEAKPCACTDHLLHFRSVGREVMDGGGSQQPPAAMEAAAIGHERVVGGAIGVAARRIGKEGFISVCERRLFTARAFFFRRF
jgi:hypothetical protein